MCWLSLSPQYQPRASPSVLPLSARSTPVNTSAGGRSWPELAVRVAERASASSSTAATVAARSPFAPAPKVLAPLVKRPVVKALETRCT